MNHPAAPTPQAVLDELKKIARSAGETILELYKASDMEIMEKPDKSLVTEADLLANDQIVSTLLEFDSSLPIITEESHTLPYTERSEWDRFWLIDPLDGTREFINQTGDFSVNIALIEQNTPIIGVIYFPATETLYYAARNQGAFKCQAEGKAQRIKTRTADPGNLVLALSRRRSGPMLAKFLDKVGSHHAMVHGGCLKSCLVAEGVADAFPCFGPTYEWDTAAAQILLSEAGGALLDFSFSPLKYNFEDSLINPSFIAVGDPNYRWRRWLPEL